MWRFLKSPSDLGLCILLTIIAVVAACLITLLSPEACGDTNVKQESIASYIRAFVKVPSDPRYTGADELAQHIVEQSTRVGADPYAVAVLLRFESSFRAHAVCRLGNCKGERGLGQLHGLAYRRARKYGCELGTVEGQVCGAAYWWREMYEKCGNSPEQAFRAYQTGDCRIITAGSVRRLSQYRRLTELSGMGG